MLARDEALTICETVLSHAKAAGAEDAIVSLDSSVQAHARFADNRITTSGRAEELVITATVWVGRRRGSATGSDPGSDGLKRMADEVVEMPLSLFNAPADARGFMTTGGTETIIQAMQTCRDWTRKQRNERSRPRRSSARSRSSASTCWRNSMIARSLGGCDSRRVRRAAAGW